MAKDVVKKAKKTVVPTATKNDELIGFHKGSLSVLAKEREEMSRILSIVEQLMQAHITELNKLGVDLNAEAQKAKQPANGIAKKKPIDELL